MVESDRGIDVCHVLAKKEEINSVCFNFHIYIYIYNACYYLNRYYYLIKNVQIMSVLEFGSILHLYSTFNGPMVESGYGELVKNMTPFLAFYFILFYI